MCGFVGIINSHGKEADYPLLKKMGDTIHHRGPDDEGYFIHRNIGFFHKRLSIIDLVTGHQPMTFDGITIVYNGEIYNYIELRDELKRKGHQFQTTSDTEVIIRLYIALGNDFVHILNGMFAFIIYDQKKQKILIARDHFGIKPLYFYKDDEKIAIGSEIKAILSHPDIEAIPDKKSIHEYLTFQFIMGEDTMFKNIRKVPPGHYFLYDCKSGKITKQRYWQPNFKLDPYHTEEYFIVKLGEILKETIRQQLRSDVPLGTYLSGGIDSSLVTIMSSGFYKGRLKSFTGAFKEGPEFSELEYARIAARKANAELYEIYPTEQEFIDVIPKLIYHLDEPVAGPGLFPQYIVSKLASEHVKVILGGQGGDEIFGGYVRYLVAYLEQALKGAINENNEEGEHIVSLRSILPNLPSLRNYLPMMKSFWSREAFEPMDRRYFNLLNRLGTTSQFLNKEFLGDFDLEELYRKFAGFFNDGDTRSYFNKMTHFDMFGSLPALLQVEDRVSMAVSIESRVPLLDRRIVDLISPMPAGMKFRGAEMKYLLKKTIKNILPKQILNRKDKMGFPVPLHIWSKNKAKDFILDVFLSQNAKDRNIINTSQVESIILNEQPFGRGLWGLLSLELWYQQFIDK
jgi:asparagine synthase (glutamine-hydrolysing)